MRDIELGARDVELGVGIREYTQVSEDLSEEENEDGFVNFCKRIGGSLLPARGGCRGWQLLYAGLAILGCVCFVLELAAEDFLGMSVGVFLILLALYCTLFIGSDPCLLDDLRQQTYKLSVENGRLNASNNELEAKLDDLKVVNKDLEAVQNQLAGQAESAENVLLELEQLTAVDTVSAAVSHFFAADRSGDGIIDGNEALRFVKTFTLLKELVPNCNFQRLEEQVAKYGLNLSQFSVLLSTLVAQDPAAAREELEQLYAEEELEEAGEGPYNLFPSLILCPGTSPTVRGVTIEDEDDVNLGKSKDDDLFQPWVLGPLKIYGVLHAIFCVLLVVALGLVIAIIIVDLELTLPLICSVLSCGMSSYLTVFGQLVVISALLKVEIEKFRIENNRLQESIDELGSEISRLVRLHRGFLVLQQRYGGLVTNIRNLLTSHRSHSLQSAVGAVMDLFTLADENEDLIIDEYEAEEFYRSLEACFKDVPSFDINKIKTMFAADDGGIDFDRLPELVNVILKQT